MITVKLDGKEYQIDETSEESLMNQLKTQGVEIVAACNGAGICQTCSIRTISGEFSDKTETEEMMDLPDGQRMSCQCTPKTDCEIELIY